MKIKQPSEIIREPIQLSRTAIAVIHVFDKHDHLEDLWMADVEQYYREMHDTYSNAADQFVEQLEGEWNMKFMYALRDRIQKEIDEFEERKKQNPLPKPKDYGNM